MGVAEEVEGSEEEVEEEEMVEEEEEEDVVTEEVEEEVVDEIVYTLRITALPDHVATIKGLFSNEAITCSF